MLALFVKIDISDVCVCCTFEGPRVYRCSGYLGYPGTSECFLDRRKSGRLNKVSNGGCLNVI